MSNYRNIAPTSSDIPASSSSSNSKEELSGSIGGDGSKSSRRRRPPGDVNTLACQACRHARSKCDGVRPDPCGRCISRNQNCVYGIHVKTHKGDMIREIQRLEEANFLLQEEKSELLGTNSGLRKTNQGLHEASESIDNILEVLSSRGHSEEIKRRLREGDSHHAIAAWLGGVPPIAGNVTMTEVTQRNLIDVVRRVEKYYRGNEERHLEESSKEEPFQWTRVTADGKLMKHLLNLYFTWVHPVHMLFSELEFLDDFASRKRTHCSSALVNAIFAMACHLLEEHGDYPAGEDLDVETLREGFMNEARTITSPEDYTKMTAIQAFAIMFLVDLSSGKALKATGYLRLAADGLRSMKDSEHSAEAVQLSLWGVHTLNTAWAAITYQKPFSPESPRSPVFANVQTDKDDALWRFYRRPGDKNHVPRRPSYAILTACHQAHLYRIVHETITMFCGANGKVTARKLLECYRRYLTWKDELPAQIAHVDTDAQALPHILFLHMQYHTALILLFLPLLHVEGFSGGTRHELKRIILASAKAGLEILEQSERLYSCRYQLPLMVFCTIHMSDVLIRYSPSEPYAPEVVDFCFRTLKANRPGFAICGPLQELFRKTAVECQVQLPSNIRELMQPARPYGVDDILDACGRISYTQPTEQIVRYIDEGIAEDWEESWRTIVGRPDLTPARQFSADTGRVMHINWLLND